MTHPSVAGISRLPGPVAWVFTGGGARAAAQVGMAEVLLEQGLTADLLVGSGTGAINATALIEPTVTLRPLRQTWQAIGTESALESLGAAAVRAFSARRTGRSTREYREVLAGAVPGDPRREIPQRLRLVASDLVSGRPVVLTEGPLLAALAGAAGLPLIFQPLERDGMFLVDGSLTAAAPLDQALAAGAGSIVLFDTGASAVAQDSVPHLRWWQMAALAYSHQVRGQLGHALMRTAARVPVVTFTTSEGAQFDFTQPDELFAAGRSAASTALAHGLGSELTGQPGIYGVPLGYEQDPRLVDLIR